MLSALVSIAATQFHIGISVRHATFLKIPIYRATLTTFISLSFSLVPADQLDAAVEELVAAIVSKPRVAIRMGKELVYRQREMGLEPAYQLAGQTMAVNMMDVDAQEGAQAFAQKRKPVWQG